MNEHYSLTRLTLKYLTNNLTDFQRYLVTKCFMNRFPLPQFYKLISRSLICDWDEANVLIVFLN